MLKSKKKILQCLSPGSNWGPLVCETNVITNYTTQTICEMILCNIMELPQSEDGGSGQ